MIKTESLIVAELVSYPLDSERHQTEIKVGDIFLYLNLEEDEYGEYRHILVGSKNVICWYGKDEVFNRYFSELK